MTGSRFVSIVTGVDGKIRDIGSPNLGPEGDLFPGPGLSRRSKGSRSWDWRDSTPDTEPLLTRDVTPRHWWSDTGSCESSRDTTIEHRDRDGTRPTTSVSPRSLGFSSSLSVQVPT